MGWERGTLIPNLLLGVLKSAVRDGERLTDTVAHHQRLGTPELPVPSWGQPPRTAPCLEVPDSPCPCHSHHPGTTTVLFPNATPC